MDRVDAQHNLTNGQILGVPAQTSLGFLEAVFECYDKEQVFSILRPGLDTSGLGQAPEILDLASSPTLGWGSLHHKPSYSDAPAQIVFTSGTEGRPKPIILSHRNLANVVGRLNDVMGLTQEVREYIGVPVSYSFGLGRVRAVCAAGGRFYLPERFDPTEIRDMLAANEINAISAVPSLWRVVLANPELLRDVADRVRWIEIGSQYMSATEKAAMIALFPNARIVQHYGLTEASRSTFLVISDTAPEHLEAVGTAGEAGVDIAITDEGAISIRGAHVALGQAQSDGSIIALTDDDGWLTTRDRGKIEDGQLYYLGRLDDQINVGGIKLGSETLEDDIRQLVPAVTGGIAVAPLADSLRGEIVLVAIETRFADLATLVREAATLVLNRKGLPGSSVLRLGIVPQLPRTATDKIQRRRLPELLASLDQDPEDQTQTPRESVSLSVDEARIATLWQKVLPVPDIRPEQSFYDAGGDSLSSVQVGLTMEASGATRGEVRATLEGRALSNISNPEGPSEERQALPDMARRTWAIGMTRGVMVVMVLLSHWGPGLFKRLGLNDVIEPALSILYRSGTPGFATVFGIGIGAFMVDAFRRDPHAILKRQRMSFWLVLSGILLLALAQITLNGLSGTAITGKIVAFGLYGVLAYYAFALISGPLWMAPLAKLRHPMLSLPPIALGLWALWLVLPSVLPSTALPSVLEFFRLMGLGVYSVPKLAGVTCFGILVGLWLNMTKDTARAARGLMVIGLCGAAATLATVVQSYGIEALGNRSHPAFVSLPATGLYIFLVTAMAGTFLWLLGQWAQLHRVLLAPLRLLTVLGGLALPIYVFHGLVIPVKDIMVTLGLPSGVSLVLSLGAFLVSMGIAGRRLYRMYFA